jgi:hypothetical protein
MLHLVLVKSQERCFIVCIAAHVFKFLGLGNSGKIDNPEVPRK